MTARLLRLPFAIAVTQALFASLSCLGEDPSVVDARPADSDAGDGDAAMTIDADTSTPKPEITGKLRWFKTLLAPAGASVRITGGAVDTSGNVLVIGTAQSDGGTARISFGDGKVLDVYEANHQDAFVARYDQSGACSWVQIVSGTGNETLARVAFSATGDAIAVGDTQGVGSASVVVDNIGESKPPSGGARDIVLLKLDASGRRAWHEIFGGPQSDHAEALAVNGNGDIVIGGSVTRSTDTDAEIFPPSSMTYPPSPARAAFAALLDEHGKAKWAHGYPALDGAGVSHIATVRAAAFDAMNDVVVAGRFDHSIDLRAGQPGASLTFVRRGGSGMDGFVAKLGGASGQSVWGAQLGGDSDDTVDDLAVDDARNVYLAGSYTSVGSVSIGAHSMPVFAGVEAYVTKLDPDGTVYEWARAFGSAANESARTVAIDPWGNILLGGTQQATLSWGGPATNAGGFVAKLDPLAQTALWTHGLGGSDPDVVRRVAIAPASGITVVTGTASGVMSVAGQPLAPPDAGTTPFGYVIVLDP